MAKTKKPKIEPELIAVTFLCPVHHKRVTVLDPKRLYWSSDIQECDFCGSHGFVRVEFTCCLCNKTHEVEVHSW